MRIRYRWLVGLAALLVLGMLVVLARPDAAPVAVDDPGTVQRAPSDVQGAGSARAASDGVRTELAPDPVLAVKAVTSDAEPVVGAKVCGVSAPDDRMLAPDDFTFSVETNAEGFAAVPSNAVTAGSGLLVMHPGFASRGVSPERVREAMRANEVVVVVLERGLEHEFRFEVWGGAAVPAQTVWMTELDHHPGNEPVAPGRAQPVPGIGPGAVYQATSDGSGIAVVRGLKRGRYRVFVRPHRHFAVKDVGERGWVTVPGEPTKVTLWPVHAGVLVFPGHPVFLRVDHESGTLLNAGSQQLARLRSEIGSQWRGGRPYVALPVVHRDEITGEQQLTVPHVRWQAFVPDLGWMEGRMRLRPLADGVVPTVVEGRAAKVVDTGTVVAAWRDPMPTMYLTHRSSECGLVLEPGRSWTVPAGTYELAPRFPTDRDLLGGVRALTIEAGEALVLDDPLPDGVGVLRLAAYLPDGQSPETASVRCLRDGKAVANRLWQRGAEHTVMAVPIDSIRVEVSCQGCEKWITALDIRRPATGWPVDLTAQLAWEE